MHFYAKLRDFGHFLKAKLTGRNGCPRGSRKRPPSFRPAMEILEERRLLATWIVTSTADSGPNTLRWAIESANTDGGFSESILFQIATGAQTIVVGSSLGYGLPEIKHSNTTIDGTSQPGYAGTPLIELLGAEGLGDFTEGLLIAEQASNCVVQSLSIAGFGSEGISVDADDCTIKSNIIFGNRFGVSVSGNFNTVGGTAEGAGNLISNNSDSGVVLSGSESSKVQGNRIGTTANGNASSGNGVGVRIDGECDDDTIGGTDPGAGNLISGNRLDGIVIENQSSTNPNPPHANKVQGNRIGTTLDGSGILGNGGNGILIMSEAYDNLIGGPGGRNIISGNGAAGVKMSGAGKNGYGGNQVISNYIGTANDTAVPRGNQVGVVIDGGSVDSTIGPDNVISGNLAGGIVISETGTIMTQITGNKIGTDASGMVALGNGIEGFAGGGTGVLINDGANNNAVIGNLISGHSVFGVRIHGSGADMNEVKGNQIGTDATGASALPNGTGVLIDGGAAHNSVGGTKTGTGNLISGNLYGGLEISGAGTMDNHVQGNHIGTDITGTFNLANLDGVLIDTGASANVGGGSILRTPTSYRGTS
jgi:hypothetical protein